MDEDEIKEKLTDKQKENSPKPWLWKKGQSGNIMGRPKGKSMKEYSRQFLERMSDEERDEWLEGLPKEIIWQMSEGRPEAKTDLYIKDLPTPLLNGINNVHNNLGNAENIEPNQEN